MKAVSIQVDPLQGSIVRGMTLFALPIMATAFLQVLFSSVDTMVVGRFGTENAMASVGVSASMINLIVSGVTALNTGISITAGYHYGKREFEEIRSVLQSLPLTGFGIGLFIALLTNLFWEPLLRLVQCPDSLMSLAGTYFRIYFLSVPFMLVFSFLAAILQARGQSLQPFLIQMICSVANLALNLFFVIVLDMDVAGVAVATVISQALSAALMILYFLFLEKEFPLKLRCLTLFKNTGTVFRLGIPTALEGIFINLSGVVIQAAINGFPEYVIAGNTVASSIEGLMSVAFVGFASGSVVFISQNYGSGNLKRVRRVHRTTAVLVFSLGEVIGILVYLLSPWLILLYTDSRIIAEAARLRMAFMCLACGLCGTMNSLGGCIQGLGDTKTPLIIALITSCGFRILWIFTAARWIGGIQGIYISYPLCWGLTSFLYLAAFHFIFKRKITKL